MTPVKNIVVTIFFMIYIIKMVYSTPTTKEDVECYLKLYASFGFNETKRYQYRNTIPKLAFEFKLHDMFDEEGEEISLAKRYFIHIHDVLRAKDGAKTLRQWCSYKNRKVYKIIKIDGCHAQLRSYFKDSDDPTEILKHAYLNLVDYSFKPNDKQAQEYFKYLLSNLDSAYGEDFMTPLEICQGKTKASQNSTNSKRKNPDGSDYKAEIESNSLKHHSVDSTTNIGKKKRKKNKPRKKKTAIN